MATVAVDTLPAIRHAPGWRPALLLLLGGVLLACLTMAEAARSLVGVWSSSATFGYGFLIAPAALVLAWQRRGRMACQIPRPWLWGLPAILLLSLAGGVAALIDLRIAGHAAFVLTLQLLVPTVLGLRIARTLAFPLGFLILMVPAGEGLVPLLQTVTAEIAVAGLRLTGVPVFSDGVFISIPAGRFEVAEACAGLRFLAATLVVGLVVANSFFTTWRRRALFLALCLLVPVAANGLRVIGIILLAHHVDPALAASTDHVVYGGVFLGAILALLLLLAYRMRQDPAPVRPVPTPGVPAVRGSLCALLAPALAAVLAAGLLPSALLPAGPGDTAAPLSAPAAPPGWRAVEPSGLWRPRFVGADAEVLAAYQDGGRRTVELHLARQRPGAGNSPTPEGWRRVETRARPLDPAGGRPVAVREDRIVGNGRERLVWHWLVVDGTPVTGGVRTLLLELRGLLHGRREAMSVTLAVETEGAPAEAAAVLTAFLSGVALAAPADGRY
ncbi:exosortase A [Rhodocista pekingensis]|uniref:Exosortase A n=1 Tax=Rhodocista pekingensis TaxID=201185 RepID=A0ABW2L1W9_9PROT